MWRSYPRAHMLWRSFGALEPSVRVTGQHQLYVLTPSLRRNLWEQTLADSSIPRRNLHSSPAIPAGAAKPEAAGQQPDALSAQDIDLRNFPPERIRNFSIIAHIDHGKSTIADRLLELTGTIRKGRVGKQNEQFLDKLQVEKERGITVKAQTVSMFYDYNGERYLLNLIDTPGHVDFSYEVSCSLAACQGTLLVVDAAQGVQAQTLANFYLAFERDVNIVPVMNKIDMAAAKPDEVAEQMHTMFDAEPDEIIRVSAKTGQNIDQILPAVIERVPPPSVQASDGGEAPLSALLFDSWFDDYRGVVSLVEVMEGQLTAGQKITSQHAEKVYEVQEVGIMHPGPTKMPALYRGQVGYMICGMRRREEARVGDTFHLKGHPVEPMPGFKPAKSMVFAGVYPIDQGDYEAVSGAVERLSLNDPSVSVKRDVSVALGPGWRLGFLGMLHLEVFSQRLEQEYNMEVLITSPSVTFKCILNDGTEVVVDGPSQFPDPRNIREMLEPMVLGTLIFPEEYIGGLISLCEQRRGQQVNMSYFGEGRVMLKYRLPLGEIVEDFYDEVKSVSSGYASFDYEEDGYMTSKMSKVQILVNGEPLDALACCVHESRAFQKGKAVCKRLKETIPRQLFDIAVQAVVNNKVIARETVKALRKDVTAKCYGGDVSRKMKLLQKQKEGKKKMRSVGNVQLPKEAFLSVLKRKDE